MNHLKMFVCDFHGLFSFGERISLSIILSMRERSGIIFKITCSVGILPHLNIDIRYKVLVTDIKGRIGFFSQMFTNYWSITLC